MCTISVATWFEIADTRKVQNNALFATCGTIQLIVQLELKIVSTRTHIPSIVTTSITQILIVEQKHDYGH